MREHFLPPLLDAILGDYRRNVPEAREPEVLSTVSTIVDKLEVGRRCLHSIIGGGGSFVRLVCKTLHTPTSVFLQYGAV